MSSFLKLILYMCLVGLVFGKHHGKLRGKIFSFATECSKEYNVTSEEMDLLRHHVIPDSDEVKCLLYCAYRKADWMNDEGFFDIEGAVKMVEKVHSKRPWKVDRIVKLFNVCKIVNDEEFTDDYGVEEGCQRAGRLAGCLLVFAPKLYPKNAAENEHLQQLEN